MALHCVRSSADSNADAYTDADTNPNTDAYTDTNANAYTDTNADANADTNSNTASTATLNGRSGALRRSGNDAHRQLDHRLGFIGRRRRSHLSTRRGCAEDNHGRSKPGALF